MSVDVENLPEPVRQAILTQAREQLGDVVFRQLVARYGENRVLRMAMGQEPVPADAPTKDKKKPGVRDWLLLACCVGSAALFAWGGVHGKFGIDAPGRPPWLRGVGGGLLGFLGPVVVVAFLQVVRDKLRGAAGRVNDFADETVRHDNYTSHSHYLKARDESRTVIWVVLAVGVLILIGVVLLVRRLVT